MVAWGHSGVGVSVGIITYSVYGADKPVEGLVAAGIAGLVSHYVADFIPHGHFAKRLTKNNLIPILFFDLFLGVAFFLGLEIYYHGFSLRFLYILFGLGGSQLPDVLFGLTSIGSLKQDAPLKSESNFHQSLHWHGRGNNALLIGARDIWQLAVIGFTIYLILK